MRTSLLSILLGLAAAASLSAQSTPSQAPSSQKPSNLVTLSGCVSSSEDGKKSFTLADGTTGATYLLKGMNVRDYVGKQVEITGTPGKRLVVRGGLWPNANVAAQAGAMDPTKAAMAAQTPPPADPTKPTTEFTVKSARVVPGTCEEK